MHESSLGQVITDYLTGREIEETTYEEFRQALARMLVEEKGYPRERLLGKAELRFPVDGRDYVRVVDLAVHDEAGRPVLCLFFCSGMVASYHREAVAGARLYPGGPAPFAAVTDTKDAVLLSAADGSVLKEGMSALPVYDHLLELARKHPVEPLSGDRLEKERRILYTYSEFLTGCCGAAGSCSSPASGPDGAGN